MLTIIATYIFSMIPHAPISRIEIQKSQESFHTIHLRQLLTDSLTRVGRLMHHLFMFDLRMDIIV
jgi:hypothetical protein